MSSVLIATWFEVKNVIFFAIVFVLTALNNGLVAPRLSVYKVWYIRNRFLHFWVVLAALLQTVRLATVPICKVVEKRGKTYCTILFGCNSFFPRFFFLRTSSFQFCPLLSNILR